MSATFDLHPLTPLSATEIGAAVAIIKRSGDFTESCRVQGTWLDEPEKACVMNHHGGVAPVHPRDRRREALWRAPALLLFAPCWTLRHRARRW